MAEEEEEYESDPEQAKMSLKMRRRREASDDEDDDDNVRVRVSDCEDSDDGQGAAADEYDNGDDDNDDDDDEYDDLVEKEEAEEVVEEVVDRKDVDVNRIDGNENGGVVEGEEEGEGEVKKENEPFAVPTAGAFYMHDDRFRDSAGGRHRRAFGRGKLWELRDDRKWGHDKFEELTTHERHYDEGRRVSRGRNRGRGRSRGEDRQFVRGNRPKTYDNNNQVNAPKSVRGRGPRRYQPSSQNSFEPPAQNRAPAKTMEKTSNASSGRASSATSAKESAQLPAKINVAAASSLNSASPPFYPSSSSSKETNSTQKKDAQTGSVNRGPPRGRNVSDSLSMDKLYIDDSVSSLAGKPLNNLPLPAQPRGAHSFNQVGYQQVPPHHHNQVNRVTNQLHPSLQSSGHQYGPLSASGSRASSPPTKGSLESVEIESSTESNDFKTTLVGKGKGSIASSGMSSYSYSDQNFPGAANFLPVMQFAGQHHPGGLGVPAVGMAFPGYVSQPNGMGNSEMTWLPVLAGAAGALGAAGGLGGTYPYITMDGAYHPRPSGQASSLPPPTNKPANEIKPSKKPEFANDELRQRQNKARRYTEMKFDK